MEKTLKKQMRKLNLAFLLTKLKPDMFYSIGLYETGIMLQGLASQNCSNFDLTKFKKSANGYYEYTTTQNINITLT